ncbi:hypothetical protein SDC9_132752 [bioreactor metagenome]|uniref:Uncharacterized protein n=1 Tax=bioreactor metagenome TaxID=1076179 RepID=A0A645D8T0_9ZZZZ|nr:hypothetical protein [Aminobacterium sp.]MEA4876831.1 hypothetical protein [Aminobacterium sp.]
MFFFALGPLNLSKEGLWEISWGEYEDLLLSWQYREYLEYRKTAALATWVLNGTGKRNHPVLIDDLIGVWDDGEIMSKQEHFDRSVQKIKNRKQKGGDDNGTG